MGLKGEIGSDVFTFYITSPQKLEKIIAKSKIKAGRGLLIMNDYDIKTIEAEIKRIISKCKGATWQEIAKVINQFAYWEYDSYLEE